MVILVYQRVNQGVDPLVLILSRFTLRGTSLQYCHPTAQRICGLTSGCL